MSLPFLISLQPTVCCCPGITPERQGVYVNSQKTTGKLHHEPHPRPHRAHTGRGRQDTQHAAHTPELGTTGKVLDSGRRARPRGRAGVGRLRKCASATARGGSEASRGGSSRGSSTDDGARSWPSHSHCECYFYDQGEKNSLCLRGRQS